MECINGKIDKILKRMIENRTGLWIWRFWYSLRTRKDKDFLPIQLIHYTPRTMKDKEFLLKNKFIIHLELGKTKKFCQCN